MWNKITGKSSDTASASQSGERRRKHGSSGGSRRAESVISSTSTRRDRDDDGERKKKRTSTSSRTSTYPPPAESIASASTYATAPSSMRAERDRDRDDRSMRISATFDDAASTYSYENLASWEKPAPDSEDREEKRRSERGVSESDRDREERRRERRERRERESERREGKRVSGSSRAATIVEESKSTSRAGEDFVPSSAMPGSFSPFPGQPGAPTIGSNPAAGPEQRPQPAYTNSDPHIAHQFPGQTTPSPYGAAADYYGDQGQSVQYQPGVRPEAPLVNGQPHLMSASATAAPAQDTGNGSAVDYFTAGPITEEPSSIGKPPRPSQSSSTPSKPSKPGKTSSGSSSKPSGSGKLSSAAVLAGGAAMGYALGHQAQDSSSSLFVHGAQEAAAGTAPNAHSNSTSGQVSPGGHVYSLSAPTNASIYGQSPNAVSPSQSPRVSPSNSPRPGKTNYGAYAAGAAGLAAGAYALHNHNHSHGSHSQHQHTGSAPGGYGAAGNGNYGAAGFNGSYGGGNMATQSRSYGPVDKLVDWWKDHEDVRKMEEYTEFIGVCRGCFDPHSHPWDAPRKHHYRKRKSTESLRSGRSGEFGGGRVSKESRYGGYRYDSDEEKRRKSNKGNWIAAGLGAYGLAKAGKAVLGRNGDFDDTYSVKSGRKARTSRTYDRSRSRSSSRDRKSTTSYGVVGRRRSGSLDRRSGRVSGSGSVLGGRVDVVGDGKGDYRVERRRSSKKTRSRSSSRERKSSSGTGLLGAAAGAALAGSAIAASRKHRSRSRSRSYSPNNGRDYKFVRRRRGSHDSISVYGKGSDARSRASRSSFGSSREDVRSTGGGGFLGGIFGGSRGRRVSPRRKRKTGFFTFGNGSSSSDVGLAYGADVRRGNRSSRTSLDKADKQKKGSKRRSSDEKINATLLGIGATAAALAAAQAGRSKHSKADLVAVKERKDKPGQRTRGSYLSRPSGTASHYDSADDDDAAWEDEPGDDSSIMSGSSDGLAYGDFDYKGKARKSTDSLVSNDSGTWKWGWRWGNKKNKRKSAESLGGVGAIAGAAAAGAVAGHVLGQNPDAMSSLSSQPSMQNVYPVQSADPLVYDAGGRRRDSQPIYSTSRPDELPLSQPQPMAPINGSSGVYTSAPAYSPGYTAPSGPPVFYNESSSSRREGKEKERQRPVSYSSAELARRQRDSENEKPPQMPPRRRRASSPTPPHSNLGRDALIGAAGVAAGVAAASALSNSGSFKSPGTPSKDVRFSFNQEQLEREQDRARDARRKEDDEERRRKSKDEEERGRKRKESEGRERERAAEEERLRRQEEADRIRRQQAEEELARERRREEEARAAATRRETERKAEAEREAARRAQLAREADEREQQEREVARLRQERKLAAREAARREAAARELAEREMAAGEDARRLEQERLDRAERLERERQREITLRQLEERERSEREERAYEIERREPERRASKPADREESKDESSWTGPVAAGVAGAAAAAAVGALINSRDDKKGKKVAEDLPVESRYEVYRQDAPSSARDVQVIEPRVVEPRVIEPKIVTPAIREIKPIVVHDNKINFDDDDLPDDVIFDPDYFKKARDKREAAKKMKIASKAADKVIADMQAHYEAGPVNNEDFWAPPELKDHSPADNRPASPNADVDIEVVHSPVDGETRSLPPYDRPYSFTTVAPSDLGPRSSVSLWPIPSLKLIEPTPPGSRAPSIAGSVRGSSAPPSPAIEPIKEEEPVGEELTRSRSASRVRWGKDQTFHYEATTPESIREKYIADDEVGAAGAGAVRSPQSEDEIVVESRDGEKTSYKPAMAATAAIAAAAGLANARGKDVVESPVEEIPRAMRQTGPVYESQSPEHTPVVIEPDEERRRGDYGFYQTPFFETVSDLGSRVPFGAEVEDLPTQQHGYVEGEVFDPTPKEEKDFSAGMPGGFIDDDDIQTPPPTQPRPTSTKNVVDEPAFDPTLPQFKANANDAPSTRPQASGIIDEQKRDYDAAEAAKADEEWEPAKKASKKDKKKKKSKRRSTLDDEEGDVERDIRDIEPADAPSSGVMTGAAAMGLAGVAAAAMAKDRKTQSVSPPAERDVHAQSTPSNINVFDYMEQVPEPQPTPDEPVISEKNGYGVDHTSSFGVDNKNGYEDKRSSRNVDDSGYVSRYQSIPDVSEIAAATVGAYDTSKHDDDNDDDADSTRSSRRKKKHRSSRHEEDLEASIISTGSGKTSRSDENYEDDKKSRRRSKRDDEDYDSPRRSEYAASEIGDEGSGRKKRRSKRESEIRDDYDRDSPSRRSTRDDDYESPRRSEYVASEIGDEGSGRKKRRSKRDSEIRDDVSVASTSRLYDDDRERRRRSKRDSEFRDDVSVASTSKLRDDDRRKSKEKDKKGGIFGLFSSKDKEDKERDDKKSRSSRNEEDEDKERRRKKRSSRSSRAGSDEEYEERRHSSRSSRSVEGDSERREKRRSKGSKDDYSIPSDDIGYKHDDDHPYSRYSRQPPGELVEEVLSHNEDGDHHEKRRSRNSKDSRDESFLGDRAEDELAVDAAPLPTVTLGEATSLPLDETTSALPDLTIQEASPDLSRDVKSFSSANLASLQTTHTEEDLPMLPDSRPGSPYEERPRTPPRPSLESLRAASKTAVPLRFRNPRAAGSSPITARSDMQLPSPAGSSVVASPSTPYSPLHPPAPRTRHSKSLSGELTKQYRPLYLVEKTRSTPDVEEGLPPLPESAGTSHAGSEKNDTTTDDEEGWRSAVESQSPEASFHEFDDSSSSRGGFEDPPMFAYQHDLEHEPETYLDSQQATPKAATFPAGLMDLPTLSLEGESETEPAAEPVDLEETPKKSREPSPSGLGAKDLATGAVLGAGAGLLAHHLLSSHGSHDIEEDRRSVGSFMGGGGSSDVDLENDEEYQRQIAEAAKAKAEAEAAEAEQQSRPSLARKTSGKKGKKGKRGSKTVDPVDVPSTSEPSDAELKLRDAQDALDSWGFDEPLAPSTTRAESVFDDAATLVASDLAPREVVTQDAKVAEPQEVVEVERDVKVPDVLLQRTPVGKKGKKKGKKGSKSGISSPERQDKTDIAETRTIDAVDVKETPVNVFDFLKEGQETAAPPTTRDVEPTDDVVSSPSQPQQTSDKSIDAFLPRSDVVEHVFRATPEDPLPTPLTGKALPASIDVSEQQLDFKDDASPAINVFDFLQKSEAATPSEEKSMMVEGAPSAVLNEPVNVTTEPADAIAIPLPLSRKTSNESIRLREQIEETEVEAANLEEKAPLLQEDSPADDAFTPALSRKKTKSKKGKKGAKLDLWGVVAAGVAGAGATAAIASGNETPKSQDGNDGTEKSVVQSDIAPDVAIDSTKEETSVQKPSSEPAQDRELTAEEEDEMLFGDATPPNQAAEKPSGEVHDDVAMKGLSEASHIQDSASSHLEVGPVDQAVEVQELVPDEVTFVPEDPLSSIGPNANDAVPFTAEEALPRTTGVTDVQPIIEPTDTTEFEPVKRSGSKKKKGKGKKGKQVDIWADEPSEDISAPASKQTAEAIPEQPLHRELDLGDASRTAEDSEASGVGQHPDQANDIHPPATDENVLEQTTVEPSSVAADITADEPVQSSVRDEPQIEVEQEAAFTPVETDKKKKDKTKKGKKVEIQANEDDVVEETEVAAAEEPTKPDLSSEVSPLENEPSEAVSTIDHYQADGIAREVEGDVPSAQAPIPDEQPEAEAEMAFEPVRTGKKKGKKGRRSQQVDSWLDETPVEQTQDAALLEPLDKAPTPEPSQAVSDAQAEEIEIPNRTVVEDDSLAGAAESQTVIEATDNVPSVRTVQLSNENVKAEEDTDFWAQQSGGKKKKKDKKKSRGASLSWNEPEDSSATLPPADEKEPFAVARSAEPEPEPEPEPVNEFMAVFNKVKGKGKKRQQKPNISDPASSIATAAEIDEVADSAGLKDVTVSQPNLDESKKSSLELPSEDTSLSTTVHAVDVVDALPTDDRITTNEAEPRESLAELAVSQPIPADIELPASDDAELIEPPVAPQAPIGNEIVDVVPAADSPHDVDPATSSSSRDTRQDLTSAGADTPAKGSDTASEDVAMLQPRGQFDLPPIEPEGDDGRPIFTLLSENPAGNQRHISADIPHDDAEGALPEASGHNDAMDVDVSQRAAASAHNDIASEDVDMLSRAATPDFVDAPETTAEPDSTSPEAPSTVAEVTPEDEWAAPSKKAKKKKGKKGFSASSAELTDDTPVVSRDIAMDIDTLPADDMNSQTPAPISLDSGATQELPAEPTVAEDDWALPAKKSKKKKGKKGSSSYAAEEPEDAPLLDNPEVAADAMPTPAIELESEGPHPNIEDNAPVTEPQTAHEPADEEEWATPVTKSKKKKKGKKGAITALVPDEETPAEGLEQEQTLDDVAAESPKPVAEVQERQAAEVVEARSISPTLDTSEAQPAEELADQVQEIKQSTGSRDDQAENTSTPNETESLTETGAAATDSTHAEAAAAVEASKDVTDIAQDSPQLADTAPELPSQATNDITPVAEPVEDVPVIEATAEDEWAVPVKKGKKGKKNKKSGSSTPAPETETIGVDKAMVVEPTEISVADDVPVAEQQSTEAEANITTTVHDVEADQGQPPKDPDVQEPAEVAVEDEWSMPAKKSKKEKRKSKKSGNATAVVDTEPVVGVPLDTPSAGIDEAAEADEVVAEEPPTLLGDDSSRAMEAAADDEWALPSKKGKKSKKSGTTTPVAELEHVINPVLEDSQPQTKTLDQEQAARQSATADSTEAPEASEAMAEDEWAEPSKKGKKGKKKNKSSTSYPTPAEIVEDDAVLLRTESSAAAPESILENDPQVEPADPMEPVSKEANDVQSQTDLEVQQASINEERDAVNDSFTAPHLQPSEATAGVEDEADRSEVQPTESLAEEEWYLPAKKSKKSKKGKKSGTVTPAAIVEPSDAVPAEIIAHATSLPQEDSVADPNVDDQSPNATEIAAKETQPPAEDIEMTDALEVVETVAGQPVGQDAEQAVEALAEDEWAVPSKKSKKNKKSKMSGQATPKLPDDDVIAELAIPAANTDLPEPPIANEQLGTTESMDIDPPVLDEPLISEQAANVEDGPVSSAAVLEEEDEWAVPVKKGKKAKKGKKSGQATPASVDADKKTIPGSTVEASSKDEGAAVSHDQTRALELESADTESPNTVAKIEDDKWALPAEKGKQLKADEVSTEATQFAEPDDQIIQSSAAQVVTDEDKPSSEETAMPLDDVLTSSSVQRPPSVEVVDVADDVQEPGQDETSSIQLTAPDPPETISAVEMPVLLSVHESDDGEAKTVALSRSDELIKDASTESSERNAPPQADGDAPLHADENLSEQHDSTQMAALPVEQEPTVADPVEDDEWATPVKKAKKGKKGKKTGSATPALTETVLDIPIASAVIESQDPMNRDGLESPVTDAPKDALETGTTLQDEQTHEDQWALPGKKAKKAKKSKKVGSVTPALETEDKPNEAAEIPESVEKPVMGDAVEIPEEAPREAPVEPSASEPMDLDDEWAPSTKKSKKGKKAKRSGQAIPSVDASLPDAAGERIREDVSAQVESAETQEVLPELDDAAAEEEWANFGSNKSKKKNRKSKLAEADPFLSTTGSVKDDVEMTEVVRDAPMVSAEVMQGTSTVLPVESQEADIRSTDERAQDSTVTVPMTLATPNNDDADMSRQPAEDILLANGPPPAESEPEITEEPITRGHSDESTAIEIQEDATTDQTNPPLSDVPQPDAQDDEAGAGQLENVDDWGFSAPKKSKKGKKAKRQSLAESAEPSSTIATTAVESSAQEAVTDEMEVEEKESDDMPKVMDESPSVAKPEAVEVDEWAPVEKKSKKAKKGKKSKDVSRQSSPPPMQSSVSPIGAAVMANDALSEDPVITTEPAEPDTEAPAEQSPQEVTTALVEDQGNDEFDSVPVATANREITIVETSDLPGVPEHTNEHQDTSRGLDHDELTSTTTDRDLVSEEADDAAMANAMTTDTVGLVQQNEQASADLWDVGAKSKGKKNKKGKQGSLAANIPPVVPTPAEEGEIDTSNQARPPEDEWGFTSTKKKGKKAKRAKGFEDNVVETSEKHEKDEDSIAFPEPQQQRESIQEYPILDPSDTVAPLDGDMDIDSKPPPAFKPITADDDVQASSATSSTHLPETQASNDQGSTAIAEDAVLTVEQEQRDVDEALQEPAATAPDEEFAWTASKKSKKAKKGKRSGDQTPAVDSKEQDNVVVPSATDRDVLSIVEDRRASTSTAAEVAALLREDEYTREFILSDAAAEVKSATQSDVQKEPADNNLTSTDVERSLTEAETAGPADNDVAMTDSIAAMEVKDDGNLNQPESESTTHAVEDDVNFFPPIKQSKKEKRKSKKGKHSFVDIDEEPPASENSQPANVIVEDIPTGASLDDIRDAKHEEPIQTIPPEVSAASANDPAPDTAHETATISSAAADRDLEYITPTKKKGKKKNRQSVVDTWDEADTAIEQATETQTASEVLPAPVQDEEFEDASTKKSKKEKRKSKKSKDGALDIVAEVESSSVTPAVHDAQSTEHVLKISPNDLEVEEAPSSTTGVDLAASVAAGLASAGFSNDVASASALVQSPRDRTHVLEEPDFDELPLQAGEASRRASRRSSRRASRAASVNAQEREPLEPESDARPPPSEHDDFAAILTAGLQGSGFDPEIAQDRSLATVPTMGSPKSLADEGIDGFSEKHQQPKRSRRGRKDRSASPTNEQAEIIASVDDEITATEVPDTAVEPAVINQTPMTPVATQVNAASEPAATTSRAASSQLPAGWFPAQDQSTGKTYYYRADGTVQWALPTDTATKPEPKPVLTATDAETPIGALEESIENARPGPVNMAVNDDELAVSSKKSKKKSKKGSKGKQKMEEDIPEIDGLTVAGAAAAVTAAGLAITSAVEGKSEDLDSRSMGDGGLSPAGTAGAVAAADIALASAAYEDDSGHVGRRESRTKRKAPPPQGTLAEPSAKKLDTDSGEHAIARITSPRPMTSHQEDSEMRDVQHSPASLAPVSRVREQLSAQDLAHSTWSFPGNRDSAIIDPQSPDHGHNEQSVYTEIRDSGYHDTPAIPQNPAFSQTVDRSLETTSEARRGRSPSHGSDFSPMKVRVEVSPAWGVAVSQGSPAKDMLSRRVRDSNESLPPPMDEMKDETEYPFPTTGTFASPPAVESTTKDRSSNILFQSSPSTRERINAHAADFDSEVLPQPIFEKRHDRNRSLADVAMEDDTSRSDKKQSASSRPRSFHGASPVDKSTPVTTPATHARTSSAGLHTIMESSPGTPESPLVRKTRGLHHQDSSRSLRRKATPEKLDLSPRQGLQVDTHSSPKRVRSTGGILSTSEAADQHTWSPADSGSRSVGIDSASHVDPSKRVRSAEHARTPSSARDLRKFSPLGDARSPTVAGDRPLSAFGHRGLDSMRPHSPNISRPLSAMSTTSIRSDRSLRRVDRSASGDLRSASKRQEANVGAKISDVAPQLLVGAAGVALASTLISKGKDRSRGMEGGDFEGYGRAPDSPMSPTRPPSVRKRQSMQIMDLQTRVDQMVSETRALQDAKQRAEQALQEALHTRDGHANTIQQATEAVASRDLAIQEKDLQIAQLSSTLAQVQEEISRITAENTQLSAKHDETFSTANSRVVSLETENTHAHAQWQATTRELEDLRAKHQHLNEGLAEIVRDEVSAALVDKDAEIERLQQELASKVEEIEILQAQLLKLTQADNFLNVRNEDYFDSACQQLCQHVQQWVLRFSKFSDNRMCRLSSDIKDEKLRDRLDDTMLDGTDVDVLLADRIKRRDVFMSVVMSMVWEYVFTRYLFGLDRDQRKKLKTLQETLTQIGPQRAVAQWRAITMTLLSRRETFAAQRQQDTEAVVQEIYANLYQLLPPPANLADQVQNSLRKVLTLAVDLAIEMRTQRAEYIMLAPLKPEYDTNGDLVQKVSFNSQLMNERSGEFTSNEELESRGVTVKLVLFPLVVKKGDDSGEGEDEIVVCPAQVLVAKPPVNKKVVRVMSGAMEIDRPRSAASFAPTESNMF